MIGCGRSGFTFLVISDWLVGVTFQFSHVWLVGPFDG